MDLNTKSLGNIIKLSTVAGYKYPSNVLVVHLVKLSL